MNPPRSASHLELAYEGDLLVARLDGDYDMEMSRRHMNFNFFESEAEARAWLDEQRAGLREFVR